MEGITGVVQWDQVNTTHPEYQRFRRLMTADVNAAVRGAFDAGATEVVITDGHAYGRNILIEELDPRSHLNSGSPSPLSMVQGVDQGVAGVLYVGYHARSGAQFAILDHTWSDERVANLWLDGRLAGEPALNGAVCGHFGAPILMVSGDQTVCAEVREWFGDVETAIVKTASGRFAADCKPPQVTQELIYQAASRAVSRLKDGKAPQPLRLSSPITMVLELNQSEMADRASSLPGARRLQDRRVEYQAADMPAIYAAFRAMLSLARG
jgi:D-amino peptidase